jgi:hypothetical protein
MISDDDPIYDPDLSVEEQLKKLYTESMHIRLDIAKMLRECGDKLGELTEKQTRIYSILMDHNMIK